MTAGPREMIVHDRTRLTGGLHLDPFRPRGRKGFLLLASGLQSDYQQLDLRPHQPTPITVAMTTLVKPLTGISWKAQ